ncbi:RRQRL motif-containing zinc-binding protein [Protofrankia symbiont of Coriaria ruscifolia]|uniref:Uncharacterized protein n=1 Tax=Candidatus Protofrankia californiensis TaxID=1839754 RepID=A0A1C3PBX1_9ACTN|nr:RRQRL motif-containing zinc-binding protein [Protofrankia symbiont of Coriaria ruscifolia]SBW27335.1 hypothetical protein FDG2_5281 [Candidatus Protofrankia californiensis]
MSSYLDPAGAVYGIPTFPYRMAPDGLHTRRQLAAMGLRPTAEPVAQVMWRGRRRRRGQAVRTAALYWIGATLLRDTPSPARLVQLADARQARHLCSACGRMLPYVIPARLGVCLDCDDAWLVAA